jgi:hypothetical protein
VTAGSAGNDGSGGAEGTVITLLSVLPSECPGAAPECPGLVEVEAEWPGAAPECPGLVEVEAEWPGAAPECPGLVEVVGAWPGAASELPGLVEIGVEGPVVRAGAVVDGEEPAAAAAELGGRPPATLGLARRTATDDRVGSWAGRSRRFTAARRGDTAITGVRR